MFMLTNVSNSLNIKRIKSLIGSYVKPIARTLTARKRNVENIEVSF
jgi:hypothetical protein